MKIKLFFKKILFLVLLLTFLVISGYQYNQNIFVTHTTDAIQEKKTFQEQTESTNSIALYDSTVTSVNFLEPTQVPINLSIYIYKNNQEQALHSVPVRAASMIKVFILATLFEEAKSGNLSLFEELSLRDSDKVGGAGSLQGQPTGLKYSLLDLAYRMITESDNVATNMLIDRLSPRLINQYIRANGYSDTILNRKMMDIQAVQEGRENYTSAKDLGLFFKRLAESTNLNEDYSIQMRNILLQQTDTECLNVAFPNHNIAHKTGELDNLYHDGGIIYFPDGNYLIFIGLYDGYNTRAEAIETIQALAHLAWII